MHQHPPQAPFEPKSFSTVGQSSSRSGRTASVEAADGLAFSVFLVRAMPQTFCVRRLSDPDSEIRLRFLPRDSRGNRTRSAGSLLDPQLIQNKRQLVGLFSQGLVAAAGPVVAGVHVALQNQRVVVGLQRSQSSDVFRRSVENNLAAV